MSRISRPSAADVAETLLEAGRTQHALEYDTELGLARHHHWLRSEAPLPEWASASVGSAARSLFSVAMKTILSVAVIGGVSVAAWHAFSGPQPSAAGVKSASPPVEAAAPSAPDVSASDAATMMARTPMPVADPGLPGEPVRRARANATDRRSARSQRAHKEAASARVASARPPQLEAAPSQIEAAAPAGVQASAQRAAAPHEVVATPEQKPSVAAAQPQPQPQARPQAKAPDDLVEMQEVATAEQLLERSPERALALVRQGDQRFANGYFQQERAYIAIMALIRLGHVDDARTRAASFAKRFPALPYGARIRSALDAAAPRAVHGTSP